MVAITSHSAWYLNPFKFVDDLDILIDRTRAAEFFHDLLVNRPTEFRALFRLFLKACNNLDTGRLILTRRQQEALATTQEALRQGIHPTRFVAQRLNISHRAVQRLLNRIDQRLDEIEETFAVGGSLHVVDIYQNTSSATEWYPREKQIRAKMASMTRPCAACGEDTRGVFALCWNCSQVYGHTREEWDKPDENGITAGKWLRPEAQRLDRQLRRDAINELYRAHSLDDETYERILENAS